MKTIALMLLFPLMGFSFPLPKEEKKNDLIPYGTYLEASLKWYTWRAVMILEFDPSSKSYTSVVLDDSDKWETRWIPQIYAEPMWKAKK